MSIFKYMPCEEELENLTESELIKRKKDSREKYLNLTNYAYDSENGKVYELLSDYKQTKDKSLLDEADD